MARVSQGIYPGVSATAEQFLCLAEEYRCAAHRLTTLGRRGAPLSRAPWRLTALHAIELYLTALLVHFGHEPSDVRTVQHDLVRRTRMSIGFGLQLRERTIAHLTALDENREYLATRYGADMPASAFSAINRVEATLDEVARKVSKLMRSAGERGSKAANRTAGAVPGRAHERGQAKAA